MQANMENKMQCAINNQLSSYLAQQDKSNDIMTAIDDKVYNLISSPSEYMEVFLADDYVFSYGLKVAQKLDWLAVSCVDSDNNKIANAARIFKAKGLHYEVSKSELDQAVIDIVFEDEIYAPEVLLAVCLLNLKDLTPAQYSLLDQIMTEILEYLNE